MNAKVLMPMIRAAIEFADTLTPHGKADVYDGIAAVASSFDHELATNARTLCDAIRESEMLQMHFRSLLTQSDDERKGGQS